MNGTLATLVAAAIGVALSPVPLIELILVLFSRRRAVNAVVFVVALLVFTVALLVIGGVGGRAAEEQSGEMGTVGSVVFLVLAGLLLLLGIVNWRNRADTSEPAVLSTIAGMGPGAVAFLAFGATFVNPKNTVLLLAAGQSIADSDSPLLLGVVFTLLATSPYTVAAGYALFGGEAAASRLDRLRAWLVERNRLLMGVVCSTLGLLLALKGLGGLL